MNVYSFLERGREMKVFISWSGTKSQETAKILKQWIPCVIQSVEPYFSSADIDKGARWSTDIAKELQDASFGILCVTKENLDSSWLNFEAGALSKSIEQSKVCPFLVDLKPSDIQNSPILQFQMTSAIKEDILRLFQSINSNLGDNALSEAVLSTTFDTFWPKIDEALRNVNVAKAEESDDANIILQPQPIEEILELVRYQHKLLKNPVELFPAEYVMSIFRENEKNIRRRPIAKDFVYEIMDLAGRLNNVLSMSIDDCSPLSRELKDVPSCVRAIREAQELSERILLISKRYDRDLRF